MNKYELTLILPGEISAGKKKGFETKFEDLVKMFKGKISKKKDWGNLELTYPIKKNETGTYSFYELELNPKEAAKLSLKLTQDEGIVRHLMIAL